MLHDILITIGVYSLTYKEVSVATVAAVLTVLGYSIYDTIIIFDRIRENVPLMRRQPFATIANVSIWETIRRSLATTFITLLPIVALLVFGGATLKDFAFALIVGVTSGAYSSIFIAAPLLTMWKEREPEFAKRKKLAEAGAIETAGREERKRGEAQEIAAAVAESEQALADESTPELVDVATRRRPSRERRRGARSAASAAARGRMAEPASERIVEVVEELLAELPARLRGSRERFSSGAGVLRAFADELGLVTRDDIDELELRVAQLEHRLKLLEGGPRDLPPARLAAAHPPQRRLVAHDGRLPELFGVVDDEAQIAASGSSTNAA